MVLDVLSLSEPNWLRPCTVRTRWRVTAGHEYISLFEWMHVIPDKRPPPSPLQGWTCAYWCRWSSVPADYGTSHDREGTAVVGTPTPPSSRPQLRAILVSFPCQGLKPAIIPGVARSFLSNPHRLLPSCSAGAQSEFTVISTCSQRGSKLLSVCLHPAFEHFAPWGGALMMMTVTVTLVQFSSLRFEAQSHIFARCIEKEKQRLTGQNRSDT